MIRAAHDAEHALRVHAMYAKHEAGPVSTFSGGRGRYTPAHTSADHAAIWYNAVGYSGERHQPSGIPLKDTFLFVSPRPDFAPTLQASIEAAGRFVYRVDGPHAALQLLHRFGFDSILVDPALSDDPLTHRLADVAEARGIPFWVLDAERERILARDVQ